MSAAIGADGASARIVPVARQLNRSTRPTTPAVTGMRTRFAFSVQSWSQVQCGVLGFEALPRGGSCESRTNSSNSTAFQISSKRRKGYPSETHVKSGDRVGCGKKELIEKLARHDLCPCGPGRRFPALLHAERQVRWVGAGLFLSGRRGRVAASARNSTRPAGFSRKT